MFVDEVVLNLEAGRGGDGCMAFHREKFVAMGGPFGGNGGKGGDIIFTVNEGLRTLIDLKYKKVLHSCGFCIILCFANYYQVIIIGVC